ncbi:MAG: hypothetical protein PHI18_00230 [bacterium]|nr:hypothetical protein [bacterium]
MNKRQNTERDRAIREEFERRREAGERSQQVIRELAERVCRSEKRIETVVYSEDGERGHASRIVRF